MQRTWEYTHLGYVAHAKSVRIANSATRHSGEEAEVVSKQESLLNLNADANKLEVTYAWNENVTKLKDNKSQAISFQKSVERKLTKQGDLQAYNDEIQKNIDKGYLVKLGKEDLEDYEGPIYYVSHHPVY